MTKRRKIILAGVLLTLSLFTFLFFDVQKRNAEENKRYATSMDLWTITKNIEIINGEARYLDLEKEMFKSLNPFYRHYYDETSIYNTDNIVAIPSFKLTQVAWIDRNQDDYLNRNTPVRGEYINLDIYTITDKGIEKETIDIFEKIRNFDDEYTFNSFDPYLYYSQDGKAYIGIGLHKLQQDNKKVKVVFLDLQTQEIIDWEKFTRAEYTFGISDILDKRLAKQGINYNPLYRNVGLMLPHDGEEEIDTGTLEDSLLAKNYPEVYQGLLDENDIYFTDMEEDPESILKVLELCFPEESELYEGITIPAEYSNDGVAHNISSRKEFLKYYKSPQEDN